MTDDEKKIEIQRLKKEVRALRESVALTLVVVESRLDRLTLDHAPAPGRITNWAEHMETW